MCLLVSRCSCRSQGRPQPLTEPTRQLARTFGEISSCRRRPLPVSFVLDRPASGLRVPRPPGLLRLWAAGYMDGSGRRWAELERICRFWVLALWASVMSIRPLYCRSACLSTASLWSLATEPSVAHLLRDDTPHAAARVGSISIPARNEVDVNMHHCLTGCSSAVDP